MGVGGGFPFNPLKVELFAGDLKTASPDLGIFSRFGEAMGVTGVEGVFRTCCEVTMEASTRPLVVGPLLKNMFHCPFG